MTVWYAGVYDTKLFFYVYFYSLHVSGSHVPIIRRIIVSMWHLVYATLWRWPSGMQEHMTQNFSYMFISILYMFRAAICPSSGEVLYQCDTWFMSLCVDDRLVCRSIWHKTFLICLFLFSTCFGQPCAYHQENYCISATPGLCHSV